MDPITLAMLGGTAVSSVIGGINANDANQRNSDIALLNYYQQRQAQQDGVAEAQRQQRDAQLGTTDASGSRTYFVPGVGWVTDLDPVSQAIMQGTQEETLRSQRDDTARNETAAGRTDRRSGQEDAQAIEAMRQQQATLPGDVGRLRDLLLARGSETRNQSADAMGEAVATAGLRRGGGFDAAALTQAHKGGTDQAGARQAGIDAAINADSMVDDKFNRGRDASTGMYDYYRRASTAGGAPVQGYMPSGPSTRSSGAADQMILNIMRDVPQQQYQGANQAVPDTINDMTTALGSWYDRNQSAKMDDAILKRWGSNSGSAM